MSSPCCFHGCCNQKFSAHRDGLHSEDDGDDSDCGGADDGDGGDGSDKEVDDGDNEGDKNDHAFGFWLLVTFAGRRSVISMSSNLWVSTSFWWIAIRSS